MSDEKTVLTRENIVEFIGGIFDRCGGEEYLGEPVDHGSTHVARGNHGGKKQGCQQRSLSAHCCMILVISLPSLEALPWKTPKTVSMKRPVQRFLPSSSRPW